MMDKYVNLQDIPSHLGITRGGVVFISSDIINLGIACMKNGEKFNANILIDAFLKEVGPNGTLIFPTYNWDFCHGTTFDYFMTKSKTGALSMAALKHPSFKRTKHPIYSFAVAGKYQDELCSMNNVSSFGADSPFAFLEQVNAQNVIIDVNYSNCFTFTHYLEQKIGVTYRYEKLFSGGYIDEHGIKSIREYSMYVRDLDLDVVNDMEAMGKDMENAGIAESVLINNLPFKIVNMGECFPLYKEDILNNKSRKLVRYLGQ